MQALLESVPIFAGLSRKALDLLFSEGADYAFADGEIIFREGEPDGSIFVIRSGNVRICKTKGDSGEAQLALLQPRELFGETCLLETLPHTATAVAVGPTTLFEITGRTFHHLYKQMPEQYGILMLNIARDLSRRLRQLDAVYTSGRVEGTPLHHGA
jgi:CRP/FNR family transcriptional regulator, cyclic AMP receptor protein